MKKLFIKGFVYVILILCLLEVYVRVFHLTKDYPTRYVDEYNVEKWMPNQEGISVTGNRRQNFSEYYINNSGYNSYREFEPTAEKIEIALVGDSFIEGFHQNYYNSIGKKIENRIKGIEVYEYGYAGYDLADQLHLINKYKKDFDLIDYVILGFKFENDLTRGEYSVLTERMKLEQPLYKNLRKIKLLVYLQTIGALDAPKTLFGNLVSLLKRLQKRNIDKPVEKEIQDELEKLYLSNFENLIHTYGFDKHRFKFLLNSKQTPASFLNYLDRNGFKYIDYSAIEKSSKPTTLIYDMHWNNRGRSIIADIIIDNFKK